MATISEKHGLEDWGEEKEAFEVGVVVSREREVGRKWVRGSWWMN